MKNKKYFITILIIAGLFASIFYLGLKNISLYRERVKNTEQDYNNKIAALQKQISGLQEQITDINKQNAAAALSAKEIANRQIVKQKSEQQLVTDTVSKIVPSVVSVVITKDIPQYQIQYRNPFGDDPFFQNFGIRIPIYVPTGSSKPQKVGAGSGFLITSDGYILTNRHVVSDNTASYTVLLSSGQQQTAKVIYKDPQNDVAIIKINGGSYPKVNLGDSGALQLGQTVIAIGNALGQYNNSVSLGIISGLNRIIQASGAAGTIETLSGVIQTDAAINPGNSGGPLVDINGNVVGINVATTQGANNISFSIPINTVKNILKQEIGI